MFTVTWSQPAEYDKTAFNQGGYYFVNSSCSVYATPLKAAYSYTGTGETVEDALAAIQTQIEAGLSKNRDKPVLEALAAFKATIK